MSHWPIIHDNPSLKSSLTSLQWARQSFQSFHWDRNHRQNWIGHWGYGIGSTPRIECKRILWMNYPKDFQTGSTSFSGPISSRIFVSLDFQWRMLVQHSHEQSSICCQDHRWCQPIFHWMYWPSKKICKGFCWMEYFLSPYVIQIGWTQTILEFPGYKLRILGTFGSVPEWKIQSFVIVDSTDQPQW